MAKVLIWLASGDKERLHPGVMYGSNAKKRGWVEDVQFVVFGAAERVLLEDEELFEALQAVGQPFYCKDVADQGGIAAALEAKGAQVIYVGQRISDLINDGYQVLTF